MLLECLRLYWNDWELLLTFRVFDLDVTNADVSHFLA